MRPIHTRSAVALALLFGTVALPGFAAAQSNPSAPQIIDALRPRGDQLGGPTRGIRPVTPAQPQVTAPEPAATAPQMPPVAAPPSWHLSRQEDP